MSQWDSEEREVIWDKGMPHESREVVKPGDPNYDLGVPVKKSCGNCDKCKCNKEVQNAVTDY